MNKIEKLINKLCPKGVEFRALGEVTIWDKKFKGIKKDLQESTIKFKHISAKDLKALECENGDIRLLSTGNFMGFTSNDLAREFINEGEIISLPSGGNANIKYFKGKFVDSGNLLAVSKNVNEVNLKFIYYFLRLNNALIENFYRGAGIKHPAMSEILKIQIPLPPLEIQREIVKILDTFTELEKELEKRRLQYEHYREKLLSFEELSRRSGGGQFVKMMKLCEVFDIKNGYTPSKAKKEYWENGTLPWFRMDDIRTNGRILSNSLQHITPQAVKSSGLFPANSIIIATTATIGEHALITVDSLANQQFSFLSKKKTVKEKLNMKFMFYYGFILGQWCKENVNVSGFASVDMTRFKNFQIPIPPLAVQNEVVDILDKFDALTNDLRDGIPAEIKARKAQYEHYREKLLTFKAKAG